MPSDKHDIGTFKKYLKGELSPEEAHTFEHDSIDDAFTQEALEGFEAQGIDHLKDLEGLKDQLTRGTKTPLPWWRYAGIAAVIVLCSYVVFISVNQIKPSDQLSDVEPSIQTDSANASAVDTAYQLPISSKRDDSQLATLNSTIEDESQIQKENQEAAQETMIASNDNFFTSKADDELDPSLITNTERSEPGEIDEDDTLPSIEVRSESPITTVSNDDVDVTESIYEEVAADIEIEKEVADARLEAPRAKKQLSGATARSASAFIASDRISGKVTDEVGEPLPGVNVFFKGTTSGTQTDFDGNFMLEGTSSPTLVFSYVGFETTEIEVADQREFAVVLGGSMELQEVVVTGLGKSDESPSGYSPALPKIGKKAYRTYLAKNLSYPSSARKNSIEGTVILRLNISPTGEIERVDIKKSLGFGCDEEAVRLIQEGPDWEPANRDGAAVSDKVSVKVKFKL